MRIKVFFIVLILVLVTSTSSVCPNDKAESDAEISSLIDKMREETYFDISNYEASDAELRTFLEDEPNRIYTEATIEQITYGQNVLNPQASTVRSAEIEFLDFMSDTLIYSGLEEFLNRLTNYSPLGPMVGTLTTVCNGVDVFYKLADVLKQKEQRYIMQEYINERRQGRDKTYAYNNTINDPIYEPVVNLIIGMDQLKQLGKTNDELKKYFWDHCENAYQAWEIANNKEQRDLIKEYIIGWIQDNQQSSRTTTHQPNDTETITNIIESYHPYANNYEYIWTISQPSASQMRLHFTKLELIAHDYLYILNDDEQLLRIYHDYESDEDFWTEWFTVDTIKIKLKTDGKFTAYGFLIDQVETRTSMAPQ